MQPVDRLMVLMNTLKLSSFEGSKILGSYLRTNRKDTVILEKLRLIQASCLTVEEEGAVLRYFVPRQERMRRDGNNTEVMLLENVGDQQSESPVSNSEVAGKVTVSKWNDKNPKFQPDED